MPRPTSARAAAVAAALALLGARARAGDWHGVQGGACSDCHTMHNSENGRPMRYDQVDAPAPGLLRDASALQLCLHCHDGSDRNAPDVMAPVGYVADPAAGAFPAPPGVETPTGHDLGATPRVPPGGGAAMSLTCTTCHAPHANSVYRNLVPNPSRSGAPGATPVVKQQVAANGTNPAQVYVPPNLVDKGGMSAWCGDCHGSFHAKTSSGTGTASPWLRHPQDEAISGKAHADGSFWLGAQPNRVRVQSPSDDVVPSADDQVFCLSCHKAHGSANRAALVFADGATRRSTCQQCHNE